MQINDFIFKRPSEISLRDFEGTIVVVCEDLNSSVFSYGKDMKIIKEIYKCINNHPASNKIKPKDFVKISLPSNLSARELIFVYSNQNHTSNMRGKLGSKLSGLIESKESLLICEPNLLMSEFLINLILRSYTFSKYKTGNSNKSCSCIILDQKNTQTIIERKIKSICSGVFYARDLTNEPSNHLNTENFSDNLKQLENFGIEVKILSEKTLKQIGMNALLAVAKGSVNPARVVLLEFNGRPRSAKRLALIGKGVMFDSGGISLKPANGMQEMTGDMGGAAVIAGLFKTLALRKSKSNVVGLLGLVENMPSSNAMKPGDIINSYKGDTIEVVNTDAEGRLVLADLLWYCQKKYQTSGIIDIATLTGAVEVALGQEYCGLFSNSNVFKNDLISAFQKSKEKVWELPLDDEFEKQITSRVADIKNSGGRLGGAITAAMFLKHFVKRATPWVHLDIAGVSYKNSSTELSPAGATGWGVRGLSKFIELNFES